MAVELDLAVNDDQLEIIEALLEKRTSFEAFCFDEALFGDETPTRHHRLICQLLQNVADGEIDRLMIFAPPGVGKSVMISQRFPAWLMGYQPGIKLIAASHTATLAARNGKKARDIIRHPAYRLVMPEIAIDPDSGARDDWTTTTGGEYYASGMLGGVTGRRADGVIIDDPFKGRKEADSDVVRESSWEAYKSDLRSRLRKDGWIVLMHQRWHDDDIAGRILPADWDGQSGWIEARDGEQWFVANLQMECEFPDNDLLGRKEGELLWPEWFDAKRVAQDKITAGSRDWNAKYQGRPRDAEGGILQRRWWRKWPGAKPPKCMFVLQSWDTAFEEDEEDDESARTTWGVFDLQDEANLAIVQDAVRAGKLPPWKDEKGKLGEVHRYHAVLLERFHGRVEFRELKREAKDGIRRFRPDRILIEKKASGHSLIQELRRARVPVKEWLPDRSKRGRAWAAQVAFEQGAIWHMDRTWAEDVIDQCARFPTGKLDDIVDTVTMSIIWLRRMFHLTLKGEEDEDEADEELAREMEIEA